MKLMLKETPSNVNVKVVTPLIDYSDSIDFDEVQQIELLVYAFNHDDTEFQGESDCVKGYTATNYNEFKDILRKAEIYANKYAKTNAEPIQLVIEAIDFDDEPIDDYNEVIYEIVPIGDSNDVNASKELTQQFLNDFYNYYNSHKNHILETLKLSEYYYKAGRCIIVSGDSGERVTVRKGSPEFNELINILETEEANGLLNWNNEAEKGYINTDFLDFSSTFVNALEYACSKNPEYYITDINRERLHVYCKGIGNSDREYLENKEFDKISNDISVQLCTRVIIKHR